MTRISRLAPRPSAAGALAGPSPEFDALAGDLWQALAGAGISDGAAFSAVERVLSHALEVERRLARAGERIRFLEARAVTDDLTGLLNRRGFEDMLARTLARAARFREHGLVALVDLDGFKAVNDTYGHAAGDAVLKAAGEAIRAETRATDVAARLGGDEFALILARAEPAGGLARLERLRAQLAAGVLVRGQRLRVGASLGAVVYGPDMTAEAVMLRADRAMYRDKRARKQQDADARRA